MIRPFESEVSGVVLAELRRLAGTSGKLRTSSCLPKLTISLRLPRVTVDEAIRDLYRAGFLTYQADGRELPASGFISVAPEQVEPLAHETAWVRALQAADWSPSVVASLAALSPHLREMSEADLILLSNGLKHLSQAGPEAVTDAGFNVSARHLMGSSKVLSIMTRRMLEAIGLPLRLHTSSPRYVVCAGPTAPVATLLIENPRAFENAVRSGLAQDVALICTFGFGLSYLGEEWLHSTSTPDYDRPILIVRQGTPPPLSTLLRAPSVYLWADLDLAAISIYRSLKGAIPQLQLSKIYEAMVPMTRDQDRSHPYAAIFEKGSQQRGLPDGGQAAHCDDAVPAFLLSVCQNRAVDQEAVSDSVIRALGSFPFREDGTRYFRDSGE